MKALLLIFSGIILCSTSCEKAPFVDKFYPIMVVNNSSAEIRVYLADEFAENQYPDTTLPESKPALQKARTGKKAYFDSKTPWEENLAKLPADTLSVFFIDGGIYDNEPWDSIRVNYQILGRLDLSIADLKASNYTITYP